MGYKPDKQLFKRLSLLFPDIKFWGFGKYYENYWFLLADSTLFPENQVSVQGAIPITEVIKWSQPKPVKSE